MLADVPDPFDSRAALYDAIWTRTLEAVAREVGISGVALGKRCRRLRIPTPPRGYWAVLAVGGDVGARPPLPPDLTAEELEARRLASIAKQKASWREGYERDLRESEAEERRQRLPRAREAVHGAIDAWLEAVDAYVDANDRGLRIRPLFDALVLSLDAIDELLRAFDSRNRVTSEIRRACSIALHHVLDALKESPPMSTRKAKISPKVASALHRALAVVIDAINEPDAPKPTRRRGPAVREPTKLPTRPAEMPVAEWRENARKEAAETIAVLRRARGGPWKNYTESDWEAARAHLEKRFFEGG